jgi:hypothetical protein
MSENDRIIVDFMSGKNREYEYIIEYVSNYVDSIEFVFWPSEIALHTIYKILCESIINDQELKEDSNIYLKLKELAKKISLLRYDWVIKMQKNKEVSDENK